MKFSTKTGYGLRVMVKLAENYGKGYYSLNKFAKEENISLAYLERLMVKLKRQNFVESIKGSKGGYKLSRHPKNIKISEIFKTLEGSLVPYYCAQVKPYKCKSKKCQSQKVWLKLYQSMYNTLNSITLAEVIK